MLTTAVTVATVILVSDKPAIWTRWTKNRISRIFQFIVRQYRFGRTVWLIWRKKGEFRFPLYYFNSSHNPNNSGGEVSAALELTHIPWMGDYYIVRAFHFLVKRKRLVQSEIYDTNTWPTNLVGFWFTQPKQGESVTTTATRLSRDSYCRVFQSVSRGQCTSLRFDRRWYRRTLTHNRFEEGTVYSLIEGAPDCSLCWEIEPIRDMVKLWTSSLLQGELADNLGIPANGDGEKFSELVGQAMSEVRVHPNDTSREDKVKMLSLLEKALDYRLNQLQSVSRTDRDPAHWSEGDEKNFVSFVRSESKSLFPTLET